MRQHGAKRQRSRNKKYLKDQMKIPLTIFVRYKNMFAQY